jgi:hypothetical protein
MTCTRSSAVRRLGSGTYLSDTLTLFRTHKGVDFRGVQQQQGQSRLDRRSTTCATVTLGGMVAGATAARRTAVMTPPTGNEAEQGNRMDASGVGPVIRTPG